MFQTETWVVIELGKDSNLRINYSKITIIYKVLSVTTLPWVVFDISGKVVDL